MIRAVLLLAVTIACVSGQRCKADWDSYSGSCYSFRWNELNWFEAREFCRNEGGNLVAIESDHENRWLINKLSSLSFSSYWAGGSTKLGFTLFGIRIWRWLPFGRPLQFRYWDKGEPNNFPAPEDCTEVGYNYKWNDLNCSVKKKFVCEKNWGSKK